MPRKVQSKAGEPMTQTDRGEIHLPKYPMIILPESYLRAAVGGWPFL